MAILARRWLAAAVGGVAVGTALAQPTSLPPRIPVNPPKAEAAPDPVRTADPLGAMLADAKAAYARLRDYTGVYTRQERINGVLGAEQVAELKVRVKPSSVALRFARPEAVAGLEMVHVANTRTGKMRYRPAGAKGVNGSIMLAPDDPKVLAETRHPVTEVGVGPVIDLLAGIAAREKTLANAVEVFASDYQFAGKNVTRYEVFTRRPHAHRYAYKCLVYVDKETKLPVRFEAHDAPRPGTTVGDLLEAYSYTDLRFNVGLGDSAFE
jgi:hypothetical protein